MYASLWDQKELKICNVVYFDGFWRFHTNNPMRITVPYILYRWYAAPVYTFCLQFVCCLRRNLTYKRFELSFWGASRGVDIHDQLRLAANPHFSPPFVRSFAFRGYSRWTVDWFHAVGGRIEPKRGATAGCTLISDTNAQVPSQHVGSRLQRLCFAKCQPFVCGVGHLVFGTIWQHFSKNFHPYFI